jgi:hypothetical protein
MDVDLFQMLDDRTHGVCPACGKEPGWSSDAVPYALQPLDEAWEPDNHGRPLFAFMCSNCGFVRLHHPFPLERDREASSAE